MSTPITPPLTGLGKESGGIPGPVQPSVIGAQSAPLRQARLILREQRDGVYLLMFESHSPLYMHGDSRTDCVLSLVETESLLSVIGACINMCGDPPPEGPRQ